MWHPLRIGSETKDEACEDAEGETNTISALHNQCDQYLAADDIVRGTSILFGEERAIDLKQQTESAKISATCMKND